MITYRLLHIARCSPVGSEQVPQFRVVGHLLLDFVQERLELGLYELSEIFFSLKDQKIDQGLPYLVSNLR